MDATALSEFPAVRLASGVEPQLKWPATSGFPIKYEATTVKAVELSPSSGPEGTVITLVVQAIHAPVKLAFNSLLVETRQMQGQGITSLVATVPPFVQTQSSTNIVPISICCLDRDNMVNDTWFVTEFTYTSHQNHTRSFSVDEFTMSKRPNEKDAYFSPIDTPFLMAPYGYSYQPQQPLSHEAASPIQYSNALSFFPANSAGFSGMLINNSEQAHSPTPPPPTPQSASHAPSAYHPSYAMKSAESTTPSTAFPRDYSGTSRTNLDINGDLFVMAQSWTHNEWEDRRRLVQFWCERNSSKISCSFQPVTPGDHASHGDSIVVSCIYWAERNDFFITSVDCIYLLECLMDTRFSVEEKNRIRRNLEGFRPLTVSKCKPESTDFFKLIMAFPNPKPRNIEKDVKVFPWKILPFALKKIVAKYTVPSKQHPSETLHSQPVPSPWMYTDRPKSLNALAVPTTPSPMLSPTGSHFDLYSPTTPNSSTSSMPPVSPHSRHM